MVAVGLAAVLDSVLEDDVGLTFVALSSRAFFFVLVTPLASWRVVWSRRETVCNLFYRK